MHASSFSHQFSATDFSRFSSEQLQLNKRWKECIISLKCSSLIYGAWYPENRQEKAEICKLIRKSIITSFNLCRISLSSDGRLGYVRNAEVGSKSPFKKIYWLLSLEQLVIYFLSFRWLGSLVLQLLICSSLQETAWSVKQESLAGSSLLLESFVSYC